MKLPVYSFERIEAEEVHELNIKITKREKDDFKIMTNKIKNNYLTVLATNKTAKLVRVPPGSSGLRGAFKVSNKIPLYRAILKNMLLNVLSEFKAQSPVTMPKDERFSVPDRFSKLGITGYVALYLWIHKDTNAQVEVENNKNGKPEFLPFSNDLGRYFFGKEPSNELGLLIEASFSLKTADHFKNRWFSYKIDPLGIFEFRTDKSNLSISISYDTRHEFCDQIMDYPHDYYSQKRFNKIYELNMTASFDFANGNWKDYDKNLVYIKRYSSIFGAWPYAAMLLPSPVSIYLTRAIHLWGTTPVLGADFLRAYFGAGDTSLYPVFKEALRRAISWVPNHE